jgi:hypothetical protein
VEGELWKKIETVIPKQSAVKCSPCHKRYSIDKEKTMKTKFRLLALVGILILAVTAVCAAAANKPQTAAADPKRWLKGIQGSSTCRPKWE